MNPTHAHGTEDWTRAKPACKLNAGYMQLPSRRVATVLLEDTVQSGRTLGVYTARRVRPQRAYKYHSL